MSSPIYSMSSNQNNSIDDNKSESSSQTQTSPNSIIIINEDKNEILYKNNFKYEAFNLEYENLE